MIIKNVSKNILVLISLVLPLSAFSAGVPSSFTYQGKALNAAGTSPLLTTVSFTLSITDPSGACILYQESQSSINLATTNGLFALQVGSPIGASKRTVGTDPGLSMTQVFANAGLQLVTASGACTAGYTPAANDVRKLHVVITPSSGSPITVSPDLSINTVPNSLVAETLQGLTPANLTPPGSVLTFAGSTCPSGYLATDGSSYSTTTYPALYSAIGVTYGGTTGNFNVPNTAGIFIRGSGTQTLSGASYSGTLGGIQIQSTAVNGLHDTGHQHTLQIYGAGAGQAGRPTDNNVNVGVDSGQVNTFTGYANLSGDAETRPTNISMNYCIKY
jgi:microcystin-dependent protein